MADDHQRPGPVVEEVLQGPKCVQIEVVGRLIEKQHVGTLGQRQHQLEASLLAAGQRANRGPLGVGVKPERLHQRLVAPVGLPVGATDRLPDPVGGVELGTGLVQQGRDRCVALAAGTGGGLEPPGQDAHQRRFACAVRPDDAEPFPRVQAQLDVLEQPSPCPGVVRLGAGRVVVRGVVPAPLAVAVADAFQFDHDVAEAGGVTVQGEAAAALALRCRGLGDRLGGGDARLGLGGARRGAASQPLQLALGQVAPDGFGLGRPALPQRLAREVTGVTTLVTMGVAAFQLDDRGADGVEHVAVVGDQHQPALVGGKPFLQPGDRVEVEMVGRLVEQQQIGAHRQRPGERRPFQLATGEAGDRRVQQGPHAQTVGHSVSLPAATDRLGHRSRAQVGALGELGDHQVLAASHGAGLGSVPARDDAHQRRLARAVDTDDAHAVAPVNGEVDVAEEVPTRARCTDADEVDQYLTAHR